MAIYFLNEASFDLPDVEVKDRTVHVLEIGGGAIPGLGLMIARSPIHPGKSLSDMVQMHLDHERRNLRSWSLLFQREGEIEGEPMIDLGTRWKANDGMTYQRQVHIALGEVVLLLVGNGPFAAREHTDAYVGQAISTIRLRR